MSGAFITVKSDQGGVETFNTFSVSEATGGGGLFIQAMADTCRTAWEDNILPRLSNQVSLLEVRAIRWDGSEEAIALSTETGAVGDDALPVDHGYNFVKVTVLGRNGRMYIAGLPEGSVNQVGKLNLSLQQTVAANFNTFLSDLVAGGLTMVKGSDNAGGFPVAVNSAKCGAYVVIQRRRLNRARY